MLLLHLTDLYCNPKKYEQVLSLVNHFSPDYITICGNIFTPLPNIKYHGDKEIKYILKILEKCSEKSKILLQFAGNDNVSHSTSIINTLNNPNIIGLTNQIYPDIITFCGINYTPPNNFYINKEWVCNDHNEIDSISKRIKKIVHTVDINKTIFCIYCPPIGVGLDRSYNPELLGSYNIRKFCEGDLTDLSPRIVLSGCFPENYSISKNYFSSIDKCICIQPSQPLNDLYYSLIDFDLNLNITNIFHPKQYEKIFEV